MQFLLFLIASLFTTTAYLSPTDLFTSDPESLNHDALDPDAQMMFGADDGSQLSTNDIWTGDGSDSLAYDTGNSNDQPLDTIPPSSSDNPLSPPLFSPSDPSTSPVAVGLSGPEMSVAAGESCSVNGMTSTPISRRDINLDWLWNMFKGPGSVPEAPNVCPAPPLPPGDGKTLEPQTETGGDGSDGSDDGSDVCGDYTLICCPGELVAGSEALENCWDFRPKMRPLCRERKHLWCCLDYWAELTFYTIGPILAQNYTVIAVDLRGTAQSTIPRGNDYTSETVSEDLKGVLDFLNITETYVFAHDKGCGPAPRSISLRSENAAISNDHLERYTREISKAGFLRSRYEYFATRPVAKDAAFFNSTLRSNKFKKPVLVLGGEASLAPLAFADALWGPTAENPTYETIPKARHWIGEIGKALKDEMMLTASLGDENPAWTAERIGKFLALDDGIPSVDLSYLKNQVTLI